MAVANVKLNKRVKENRVRFNIEVMVPEVGLEPTLCCQNGILNPARLPISPLRQDQRGAKYIFACAVIPALQSIFLRIFNIRDLFGLKDRLHSRPD